MTPVSEVQDTMHVHDTSLTEVHDAFQLKKRHLSQLVIPWVIHYRDITREFFHDIIRDGIFGNRDSIRDSSVLIIPDYSRHSLIRLRFLRPSGLPRPDLIDCFYFDW